MSTWQLGKYQKETGIALIMAVFVTLFLLAISLAYIVCSKNSLNQSHLSQGKIKGTVIAEAGMERALWYLQERADATETIIAGNMPEFGSYTQLLENYRNTDEAREHGIIIPGMGTNTRYAAMTVDEEDGTVANGREIAIYVLGVTRQANTMGKEVSNIKAMKMLVRIGAIEGGMIDVVFGSGGRISQRTNSAWQVDGIIYSEEGFSQNATPNTSVSYNGDTNSQLWPNTSRDKWLAGTDVEIQGPWTDSITPMSGAATLTRGSSDRQELPVFNVADFATFTGNYEGPDYSYAELIDKGWYIGTGTNAGALIRPANQLMSIWGNPPGTVTNGSLTLNTAEPWVKSVINTGFASTATITQGVYYDRNGDGYTTIYLGQGTSTLRIMPYGGYTTALWVRPGARGVIASQGSGNNFYSAAPGISTWGGSPMGADIISNSNVGIEIRGRIAGENTFSPSAYKEVYIENTNGPNVGFYMNGRIYASLPVEPMGENWGALSIFADNDVIISETGDIRLTAQSAAYDMHSAFRGFVYSGSNLKIQSDILFQGMMLGLGSADIADHGSGGWGLASYGDGWDPSLYYEDPLNPSGGGKSFFPIEMNPSSSVVNSRTMTVLSLEADKFYKKKI